MTSMKFAIPLTIPTKIQVHPRALPVKAIPLGYYKTVTAMKQEMHKLKKIKLP